MKTARVAWVDNLRTAMIFLVVCMHACVTYSHVGSWYIMEGPEPPFPARVPFILWQGHLQSFFMGLLFFLAGTFAHRSLARHGVARFLKERLVRLGLPALLYMLVIHPFVIYVLLGLPQTEHRPPLGALYLDYLVSLRVLSGNGPLWFALALLAFSTVFVGWRAVAPRRTSTDNPSSPAPRPLALFLFGVGLVVTTFAVRLVQPIGTNVLNFQLCFFPQYIAAFAVGVVAGRDGWLEELAASRRAWVAGCLALIGGPFLLTLVLALGRQMGDNPPDLFAGGWHWPAFGLAFWEQLAGLGLALGSMAFFRRYINGEGTLARWLSARAFGVYVLHTPVLVALTPALRVVHASSYIHAALLTVVGLAASYIVADVARRIPGLKHIL
jgi:fucose 4-O-acetylase-like acetyltransferase